MSAKILELDFDVALPSTGSTITKADLEAFKHKLDILVSRANTLVQKGVSKNGLIVQLNTSDLGWRLNLTGARLDSFYAEL